MTEGRAALVGLMDRYLRGLLDPFVTLLEVHKLMYFMQESGERLRLKYQKALRTYAQNLRHVLKTIEGHLVSGYTDGGDTPDKQLNSYPERSKMLRHFKDTAETRTRVERVSDLVEGFESPFGLELLSTVHWVVSKEQVQTVDDLVPRTYAWNARKKQFSQRQIKLAVDVLSRKSWIDNRNI